MGKKTVFFDDLDGTNFEGDTGGTVSFAIQGQSYEIDLSQDNESKLVGALAPFVAAARKVGRSEPVTARTEASSEARRYELIEARKWLIENGHNVSTRGPLGEEFLRIYEEAHGLS